MHLIVFAVVFLLFFVFFRGGVHGVVGEEI